MYEHSQTLEGSRTQICADRCHMNLNVQCTCLDSGKSEIIEITINDLDNMSVKELKKILEVEIQVPVCDQAIFFQGRSLSDNSFPLKKLYLRQGDTVLVECTAQGYLSEMKGLLEEVTSFADSIACRDQSDLLTVCSKKEMSDYVSYDNICTVLEHLSFSYFIPWKDTQSVVHRHYFVQEGAFDSFMEVLKFASRRYRLEQKPNSRKHFGKSKDKDSEALSGLLKELNNEQMMLQMHCLSLLWNFSETLHDRRLVLQKGGLQLVIKALLLDPTEYCVPLTADEYYEVASINETAVGCLVQYAEFPDCQEVISSSPDTVGKLMLMVGSQFDFHQSSGPIIETYNKYPAQIAANTLFCCACSLKTPKILVENDMHKRMINLMRFIPQDELAFSYYCTLFLARIRASALVQLDPHEGKCMDDIIASFLATKKPTDISRWEENHNYVWISMIPFVSLGFSGLQIQKEKDSSGISNYALNSGNECANDNSCSEKHDPSFGMAFSDKFDGPSMVSTNQDDILKKNGTESADIERYENSCNINVAEVRQETMLGSIQTQKLGLFTLQHMLYSKGNRQLIENEHLLSFLDCLCWHVNPANGRLLNVELRKYWPPKPPSLSVICKSSLSFLHGFEAALKM